MILLFLTVWAVALGIGYYLSPQDKLAKEDAIVVISGGETDARVAEAVKLYQGGYAPLVIFSGAAKEGLVSNALAMSRVAARGGVPADREVLEEQSTTTKQNAEDVTKIVRDRELHAIILVTSPYHQRRAGMEFRRALGKGVTVIDHSATDSTWRRNGWWASPDGWDLTFSELAKVLYLTVGGTIKN